MKSLCSRLPWRSRSPFSHSHAKSASAAPLSDYCLYFSPVGEPFMPQPKIPWTNLAIATIAILTILGCNNREAEIAREAADRQARQNETMASLQQEVAAGARSLVENDAQARQQSLEVHRDLHAERGDLSGQWQDLEDQRQAVARTRRTDSFLSALVTGGGGLLAALLALAFAWLALFGVHRSDESPELACQLVEQLLGEGPLLLAPPRPPALSSPPAIDGPLPSPCDIEPGVTPSDS